MSAECPRVKCLQLQSISWKGQGRSVVPFGIGRQIGSKTTLVASLPPLFAAINTPIGLPDSTWMISCPLPPRTSAGLWRMKVSSLDFSVETDPPSLSPTPINFPVVSRDSFVPLWCLAWGCWVRSEARCQSEPVAFFRRARKASTKLSILTYHVHTA